MPPSDAPADTPAAHATTFVFLSASVLAMAYALQVRIGFYDPQAIAFYAVAFVFCVLAGARVPWPALGRWAAGRERAIAGGVLAVCWVLTLTKPPLIYLRPLSDEALAVFPLGVAALAFVIAAALMRRPLLGRWHGAALLLAFAALGGWCLVNTPNPHIDTYPMTQEASAALAKGQNPFAITFPDIYGNEPGSLYGYPPGFVAGGRVLMGYSYPPLTLLMSVPSYLTAGDHRYALLAGVLAVAGCMAYLGGATHGLIAAVLLLSFPRVYAIMESAWTEPLVLVPLAATVWCAARGKRAAVPWAFGLFLCAKQHMILFAPAALWLMPRPLSGRAALVFYAKALGIGAAVTLPFVLWDFKAFWHSVIELQLIYRARPDALSFPSFFFAYGMSPPPRFLSLALLPVVYAIAWWRLPPSVWGFALTLAFAAFTTLAFDQAFLNRNFFVLTAMLLAMAALPYRTADPSPAAAPVEAAPAAG